MSGENLLPLQLPEKEHSLVQMPLVPRSRLQSLDDRISKQERSTATLLEQAFRIKEDIIAYLRGNHGNSTLERTSHQLLESHVQVISSILKQLSTDIEILEEQIRMRDAVTVGTNYAFLSMDQKHLLGIGDLRGRITRCDASISKLAGDVNVNRTEIQKAKTELRDTNSSLRLQIKELEAKVMQLLMKIDSSKHEQSTTVRTARAEQQHQFQLLDLKINSVLSEVCAQVQHQQERAEQKLEKAENEHGQSVNRLLHSIQEKTELLEKKILEKLNHLSVRLEKLEGRQSLDIELNRKKYSDTKIHEKLAKMEKNIWLEVESIRSDYREGFQSIKESINSLNKISDRKIKLDKEKVQKDLKQIRRQIIDLKRYP